MKKDKYFTNQLITKIAILSLLAFLLMFMEFPLPMIAPSFYKLDFSELPVLIGGFILGPLAAILIEFLKIVLHLLFKGTHTAFVGELANFIVGCAYVLPAIYFFRKKYSYRYLLYGLISASITMVTIGYLLNVYLVIPAYVSIAHIPLKAILAAGKAIVPYVSNIYSFAFFCTTPFNLIKALSLAIITIVLLPRLPLLKCPFKKS